MLVSSLSSTTPTDFGELATELLSAWGDCGGVLPTLAVPKPLPRLLPNREIMAAALRSPPRLACSAEGHALSAASFDAANSGSVCEHYLSNSNRFLGFTAPQ